MLKWSLITFLISLVFSNPARSVWSVPSISEAVLGLVIVSWISKIQTNQWISYILATIPKKIVCIIHCATIKLQGLVTEGDVSQTRWYSENFLTFSVDGVDAQGVNLNWYTTQWRHNIHQKKAIQAKKKQINSTYIDKR